MKQLNTRRGNTQKENNTVVCTNRHAELVSASSCYHPNKALKQVQGDDKRAFTLIELLVVVLIIGILAAVAVPQYQKAVVKARFAEAKANLHTLAQAVHACLLTGKTCNTFGDLDIVFGTAGADAFGVTQGDFTYDLINVPDSNLVNVSYQKEPACICYFLEEGRMALAPVSNNACSPDSYEQTYDYEKLLGLTEDVNCGCC